MDYYVYQFRNGRHECCPVDADSPQMAIIDAHGILEICDDVIEIVKTTLIVRPNPPSQRGRRHRVTHTKAHLEKKRPDTLFVCAVEFDKFRQSGAAADEKIDRRECDIRQRINETTVPISDEIRWEALPEEWRKKIKRHKSGCWVWHTSGKEAPYRRVYAKLIGAIPDGALLRHLCDNRHCVNPNHLIPGTHRENNLDMLQRRRHWRLALKK